MVALFPESPALALPTRLSTRSRDRQQTRTTDSWTLIAPTRRCFRTELFADSQRTQGRIGPVRPAAASVEEVKEVGGGFSYHLVDQVETEFNEALAEEAAPCESSEESSGSSTKARESGVPPVLRPPDSLLPNTFIEKCFVLYLSMAHSHKPFPLKPEDKLTLEQLLREGEAIQCGE